MFELSCKQIIALSKGMVKNAGYYASFDASYFFCGRALLFLIKCTGEGFQFLASAAIIEIPPLERLRRSVRYVLFFNKIRYVLFFNKIRMFNLIIYFEIFYNKAHKEGRLRRPEIKAKFLESQSRREMYFIIYCSKLSKNAF